MRVKGKFSSIDYNVELNKKIYNKDQLINSVAKYNIFCIASREDDENIKYYFYGKRSDGEQYDLMEVNIYNLNELEIIIKSNNQKGANDILTNVKYILNREGYT